MFIMRRRRALDLLLKGGLPAGVIGGAGFYAGYTFLPPRASTRLAGVQSLAVRLFDSLDTGTRRAACVEYDHPLRQYHNRGVDGGGVDIGGLRFSREQRSILTDLLHAGLSDEGRRRLPAQFFINWPGVHFMKLLICGDPRSSLFQIILTGPHLNYRLGGPNREGVAFGGPMIYGDQRGDGRAGLPGNVYRSQFLQAADLFGRLSRDEQDEARLPLSPIQTRIELQGRGGDFDGVALSELSDENRRRAGELLDSILSTYAPDDVAYALRCIEENGGLDAMHLSYYDDGDPTGTGASQVFRLEGPAAVLFFRGHPHVHAFINIGMDGERPLSVGEALGENPHPLDSEGIQALFETVMREHAGADAAFYPLDAAVGRLRAGTIRTGDIYTCESWQDHVASTEMRGSELSRSVVRRLEAGGERVDPDRRYRVAATGFVTSGEGGSVGRAGRWQRHGLLRDATVTYLQRNGFPARA